jgi:putative zinc ribbon protein
MTDNDNLNLICISCGTMYELTRGEREFYAQRNLTQPKRCVSCRKRRQYSTMKSPVTKLAIALGFFAIGVAIGGAGIYIGDTDDAPGAALIGSRAL